MRTRDHNGHLTVAGLAVSALNHATSAHWYEGDPIWEPFHFGQARHYMVCVDRYLSRK